jgi:hypothetical protein
VSPTARSVRSHPAASFTTRLLPVSLRRGWGISLGGRHFHHYNIGIALLAAVGVVGSRGSEKQRRHPVVAIAYGSTVADGPELAAARPGTL